MLVRKRVVSLQDRINLAIGFGLLPVLSVAMVLAVVGASRAARLSDMQMQFMAGVTHELRTPLPAIRTIGCDRADALDSSGAEVVRYGELIRDYGRPLTEMVEQVLQLSSAGRGRYASSLAQPMSPQRRTKLSRIRLSGEHAGFDLELAHARPLSSVMADPKAPYQSLTKLLSIALEYGRPGGWVKIEAAASENGGRREVQARIRTRGPGVPLSEAPRVFEPYFRGSAAGRSASPGSGLGVNLAREVVERMGGNLTLQSEPGRESVFNDHLPVFGADPA